jgi:Protein of unknown function (DUF2829)
MDFGDALESLVLDGHKVTRRGWNGPGQYIQLQVPDENSKMTRPYIYIKTVQGDLVPWVASQTDLLAKDWEVV